MIMMISEQVSVELSSSNPRHWLHGCSGGKVGLAKIPVNCTGQENTCKTKYITGLGSTRVCCCGEEL